MDRIDPHYRAYSYWDAVKRLLEIDEHYTGETNTIHVANMGFFPIFFLGRMSIELVLKSHILNYGRIGLRQCKKLKTHSFPALVLLFDDVHQEHLQSLDAEVDWYDWARIKRFLISWEKADPNGFFLRYPLDQQLRPTHPDYDYGWSYATALEEMMFTLTALHGISDLEEHTEKRELCNCGKIRFPLDPSSPWTESTA